VYLHTLKLKIVEAMISKLAGEATGMYGTEHPIFKVETG